MPYKNLKALNICSIYFNTGHDVSTQDSSQGFFLGAALDSLGGLSCQILMRDGLCLFTGQTYIQFIWDDFVIWDLVDLPQLNEILKFCKRKNARFRFTVTFGG